MEIIGAKLGDEWQKFEKYRANIKKRLRTGFGQVDQILRGLPGFVTIQGEPKCSKSTFALNIAINNARRNIPVIWIDYENGLNLTRLRILSDIGKISMGALESEHLYPEEQERYNQALENIKKLPFYYYDALPKSLEEEFKHLYNSHKRNVLIVMDSLQSATNSHENKRAAIDPIIFEFNRLKTKYEGKLTIIAVSEKNRSSYGFANRGGGKESGGIEYKSEMVLDMYRELGPKNELSQEVCLNCNQNRNGLDGFITKLIRPQPFYYRLEEQECLEE